MEDTTRVLVKRLDPTHSDRQVGIIRMICRYFNLNMFAENPGLLDGIEVYAESEEAKASRINIVYIDFIQNDWVIQEERTLAAIAYYFDPHSLN